ncbi:MAG: PGPGW domain-containing protein [Actinomycetota bacterium]
MHDHRDRHEVWGDDPEERDASEVIAELAATEPDFERRWHHHPAFLPAKAVGRFIGRNGKRIGVTIAGFVVILAGIAMLILPGPGWAAIFLGLAILATEYVWARRLLDKAKEKFGQAKDAVLRKNRKGPAGPDSADPPG